MSEIKKVAWIDGSLEDIVARLRAESHPYPCAIGMIDGLARFSFGHSPPWKLRRILMVLQALDIVTGIIDDPTPKED
jgi:hypothetical protein